MSITPKSHPSAPLYYPGGTDADQAQQLAAESLTIDATQVVSGQLDPARVGAGSGDPTKFLNGAGNFVTPSGSPTRATKSITTASLADSVIETGTVDIGAATGALMHITVDRACRVLLYSTAAARTADVSRSVGAPATAGTGVLAEFLFTASGSIQVSPIALLTNDDVSVVHLIYYAIQNRSGSTSTVQVDMKIIPVES